VLLSQIKRVQMEYCVELDHLKVLRIGCLSIFILFHDVDHKLGASEPITFFETSCGLACYRPPPILLPPLSIAHPARTGAVFGSPTTTSEAAEL